MLGSFLFSGDDVEKKVKVLSGGERSRLALCKMLLQSSNFLILDEPTNHLDITSKEVLKSAIKAYAGSVVIVSHDRDFLTNLSTKVVEFREGFIKTHIGDINDYLRHRKLESMREVEKRSKINQKHKVKPHSREEKKRLDKEIKKFSNQLSKIERDVEKLEAIISKYELELIDPEKNETIYSDSGFFTNYQNAKDKLIEFMKTWGKTKDKLDELISQRR
jgi:ATP-binding cassette subfamily F protein 3